MQTESLTCKIACICLYLRAHARALKKCHSEMSRRDRMNRVYARVGSPEVTQSSAMGPARNSSPYPQPSVTGGKSSKMPSPPCVTGPRIDVDLCVSTYSTLKSSSILGAYDILSLDGDAISAPRECVTPRTPPDL